MGGSRAASLEVDVEKMKARAEAEAAKLKAGKLTTAEERDQGSVKWTTYADYLRFARWAGRELGAADEEMVRRLEAEVLLLRRVHSSMEGAATGTGHYD